MNLCNFPINVYSGAYTQTFVRDSFQADYFYNQKSRPADIYIVFNQFDVLHCSEFSPCEKIASSTTASSDYLSLKNNFRVTAWPLSSIHFTVVVIDYSLKVLFIEVSLDPRRRHGIVYILYCISFTCRKM